VGFTGPQAARFRAIRRCPLWVAKLFIGNAAIVVGHGERGIETDRLAVIGDGLLEAPLRQMKIAAIDESLMIVGFQADSVVEIGQRIREIVLPRVSKAAIVISARIIRSGADGGVEIGERAVQVALAAIKSAANDEDGGELLPLQSAGVNDRAAR
jgi:hypothetical protein